MIAPRQKGQGTMSAGCSRSSSKAHSIQTRCRQVVMTAQSPPRSKHTPQPSSSSPLTQDSASESPPKSLEEIPACKRTPVAAGGGISCPLVPGANGELSASADTGNPRSPDEEGFRLCSSWRLEIWCADTEACRLDPWEELPATPAVVDGASLTVPVEPQLVVVRVALTPCTNL